MTTASDIVQLLARIAVYDQRLARPGPLIVDAWREAIAPHRLEQHHLLGAVTAFYSEPRDRVIGVGDVIRAARNAREREAQTRAAHDAISANPAPQIEAGNLNANGDPVPAAYNVDGAIGLACPACDSPPGQWCRNPALDKTKKIPHPARLTAARKTLGGDKP